MSDRRERARAAEAHPAPLPLDAPLGAGPRLRGLLDEPLERATQLTQKTLAWFPIRVWRHVLQHNGFLLAAGISYQALFTIFAAIYLGFALAGVWLGGDEGTVNQLIALINSYIPDLISEHGLIKPEQVQDIAESSGSLLTITGVVALGVIIWTAIGFVTYTRRAVRDTFGLPYDARSAVVLKARDFLAALIFGVALLVGALLVQITTWALDVTFTMVGWQVGSVWTGWLFRILTLIVAFVINSSALVALFRFLTGTLLLWRRIWPGSLLGGAALALLQLGAGLLLRYTPSNPLLATFAVLIGFLLWFRLNGIVILVAAGWIAVSTSDRDLPLVELTDEEREALERRALVIAAHVRLRDAEAALAAARWWQQPMARRQVRLARENLEQVSSGSDEASGPRIRDLLD